MSNVEAMRASRRLRAALAIAGMAILGASIAGMIRAIAESGAAAVRRFNDETGVRTLPAYFDQSMQASGMLRALVIPTTVLIDREGRERWRKTGPAEWDSPEFVESLRARIRSSAP